MRLFSGLLALAGAIMVGILLWDLFQERVAYPDKKLIVYAGMFGPGEPMQWVHAGPSPAMVPPGPWGAGDVDHYVALARAWPAREAEIFRHLRDAGGELPPFEDRPWAERKMALFTEFRKQSAEYVRLLVAALGESDRENRLKLFHAFAAQPRYDPKSEAYDLAADKRLILDFERLHPGYTIGLFEDFERRHPDHKIIQRWDGRWVLSANRPRFLTGTDVPDLIGGTVSELRILMRENLAVPLDQPLPEAANEAWRTKGILAGETAYDDPARPFASDLYSWAIAKSLYTVTHEDVTESGNPYPVGKEILYLHPEIVHTTLVFYNKAHFRLIGRDPDDTPETVAEFEDICRKVIATGKRLVAEGKRKTPIEPIAQDGTTYINNWWDWMIYRQIGNDNFVATVMNRPGAGRFAGAGADPRYLEIARRLRGWRDENFWMTGFSASQWPGAQRDFGNGRCTFLCTGTWLLTEIASTCSTDRQVFEPGSFFFPAVEAAGHRVTGEPTVVQVSTQGHCLCRQGKQTAGAVLLLRYLTARGAAVVGEKLNYIPVTRNVPFSEPLKGLEPIMARDSGQDFLGFGPGFYAPKFGKFVLTETYDQYFVKLRDNLTPEQFVETIERKAQAHYQRYEGEAR